MTVRSWFRRKFLAHVVPYAEDEMCGDCGRPVHVEDGWVHDDETLNP